MPLVDMPIEQLFKYKGVSPCPKDIDEYWDSGLAEINALKHNAEFIKKEFPSKAADMYDLYYTGTKNARIHAKVAVPKNEKGKMPAVLMFHGLSGSACEWNGLLKYASQGYVVAYMDVRGQGGLSEDVGTSIGTTYTTPFTRGIDGDKHDLLMRDVFLDTALLAKIIMGLDYVDETRVGVTGSYLKKHRGEVLNQSELFMEHLDKVCSICEKYEYEPIIWSDLMFSVGRPDIAEIYPDDAHIPDEVKKRLPDVRLMYWYYSAGTKERYATFLQRHKDSGKKIAFAGGGWNWDGYFPNIDFTIKSMVPALDACILENPGFVLNTLWGNGGCETPFELCCHSNALFAEYQYGGEDNAVENAYSFCDIMLGIPKKMMDACETVNLRQRDNIRISRKLMSIDVLGAVHQPVDAFYYIENMPDIFKDGEPRASFLKASEEIDEYILEHGDIKEYFELISTVLKICADKAFVYAELQKAYKNDDKKTLSHIRDNVLPGLSYLYKKFYKLQKQQWLREYKAFGWEKDCQKIGFQIIRIDYATEMLDDYLMGRIDKIEELEAETLNQNIIEYDQRMYAPIQSE